MEKYHVISGDIDINIMAENHDDACVRVLKRVPLEKCAIFLSITKHGDLPHQERFGLTENYLERVGYERMAGNRWRKKRVEKKPKPPLVVKRLRAHKESLERGIVCVQLHRTPEEWQALVERARTNVRPT